MTGSGAYALRLSPDELVRYRMMAAQAREREGDLWRRAGLGPGAMVADIGCGPGAMLAIVAEAITPGGHAVGVDSDAQAVAAAAEVLAGVPNAQVRQGRADATGLPAGSFDVILLRHVLAHNGGAEARILAHLAGLLRPGGHALLVDVDAKSSSISPARPEVDELIRTYQCWHAGRGNDLAVGRRLGELAEAAGLVTVAVRDLSATVELPPGMRGPAWAAREELIAAGLASATDLRRWAAAWEQMDAWPARPVATIVAFGVVSRRPCSGGRSGPRR